MSTSTFLDRILGKSQQVKAQRRRRRSASDGTRKPKPITKEELRPKDVATALMVDALKSVQQNTLDQLTILRQTRSQRTVGRLVVPAPLRAAVSLRAARIDHRHRDAREEATCPICNNPNSDAGVEMRGQRAGGDE